MGNRYSHIKKAVFSEPVNPKSVDCIRTAQFDRATFGHRESKTGEQYNINLMEPKKPQLISPQAKPTQSVMSADLGPEIESVIQMPQPICPHEQFNILMSLPKTNKFGLPSKTSMINNQSLPTWQQPQQSSGLDIGLTQVQYNPANQSLNTAIMSVVQHMSRFQSQLIDVKRFQTKCTEGKRKSYETKLMINGSFRRVECISRQQNWKTLIQSAVLSTFLSKASSPEYLYRLLGWVPSVYVLSEVHYQQLFKGFKEGFNRGALIASIEIPNVAIFSVLQLIIQEGRRHIVGMLGAYTSTVAQLTEPVPCTSKHSVIKDKNVFVFNWDTLLKWESILMVSTDPSSFKYKVHFDDTVLSPAKSNFSDQTLSLFYNPQFAIMIESLEEDIELRMFLNIHNECFEQQSPNSCEVCLFSYEGNRVVYIKQEIQPDHSSTLNDMYSSIHVIPKHQGLQHFCVVIVNSQDHFDYTLQLLSNSSFSAVKIPLPKDTPCLTVEGVFQEQNVGESIFSPRILDNPIYLLKFPCQTEVEIFLQTVDRNFRVNNVLAKIDFEVTPSNLRSFLSQYYTDFVQNFYSDGFYYPSISYSRVRVEPSTYAYIPLAYRAQGRTDYNIRISCEGASGMKLEPIRWKRYQHTTKVRGFYQLDLVIKKPMWQDVFEISKQMVCCRRVYQLGFTEMAKIIFGMKNITYQKIYIGSDEGSIGDNYHLQPQMGFFVCKVRRVDGRLLAKVLKKTTLSKCPSGIETQSVDLSTDARVLFWAVVVTVGFQDSVDELEYQLSVNSNQKVAFGAFTLEKYLAYVN